MAHNKSDPPEPVEGHCINEYAIEQLHKKSPNIRSGFGFSGVW